MSFSGFPFHQFIHSFLLTSPIRSFFFSYFLLPAFFISFFRLSFLFHFFQYLLLISSTQSCYFLFLSAFLSCSFLSSTFRFLLSIPYFFYYVCVSVHIGNIYVLFKSDWMYYILYLFLDNLAVHVSGAICTHHQEHNCSVQP
jgi:hypothetical protein